MLCSLVVKMWRVWLSAWINHGRQCSVSSITMIVPFGVAARGGCWHQSSRKLVYDAIPSLSCETLAWGGRENPAHLLCALRGAMFTYHRGGLRACMARVARVGCHPPFSSLVCDPEILTKVFWNTDYNSSGKEDVSPVICRSIITHRRAFWWNTVRVFLSACLCAPKKVLYDVDGGCYELLTFSSMDGSASGAGADTSEVRRGPCLAAVFLARNRFAVLDKNRQVSELRGRHTGCWRNTHDNSGTGAVRSFAAVLSLFPPPFLLIPVSRSGASKRLQV